jgi:FMN phosphatase YigB (HAD superfamily)
MVSHRSAIIADIDNTLYNFVDFFGPAFRAMLHAISAKTGITEHRLTESFQTVYAKYQSLEYPFSVQELPILREQNLNEERLRDIVHAARVAFGQSRKNRLRLYPGVRETLVWLKQQGYILVAYSDGAYGHVERRLIRLGVGDLFSRIVAWGPRLGQLERPSDPISERIERWFVDAEPRMNLSQNNYLGSQDLKPNPQLLRKLIQDLKLDVEHSWLIGDSQTKDLRPAQEVGLQDVWARYGRIFDPQNWETLVAISPWREPVIKTETTGIAEFAPTYIIDTFADLRNLVPTYQPSLFES